MPHQIPFYDPRLPLTSFFALDLRSSSKKSYNNDNERKFTYGTEHLSENFRQKSLHKNSPCKKVSFDRESLGSSSSYRSSIYSCSSRRPIKSPEQVRQHAELLRNKTMHLKNSQITESQDWLKHKNKIYQKKLRKKQKSEEIKKQADEYVRISKIEKQAENKEVYNLWLKWKRDRKAQEERVSFSEYKKFMSDMEKRKIQDQEYPNYWT